MDEWGPPVDWETPATATPLEDMRKVALLGPGLGIPVEEWTRLHNEAWAEALGVSVEEFRAGGIVWVTGEQRGRARALLAAKCRDYHESQGHDE